MQLKCSPFSSVLEAYRAGRPVVIIDDENRENEGDVVVATELITPEAVNLMLSEARGLMCVSISVELAQRLNLPLQAINNNSVFNTPFAVSIDHVEVRGRGITAGSRAITMQRLVKDDAKAEDFVSPGHVFPLVANPAGVLGRQGQTEGSYDLSRLAGLKPSGVLCEILNPDGTLARGEGLKAFADKHGMPITSVYEILQHRVSEEILVREVASSELNTDWGRFVTKVFLDDVDGKEHLALIYGNFSAGEPVPVRLHSECLTGDVFGSRRCDCGAQLSTAMQRIVEAGKGILLYLRQEGRGIGLANKLKAYALQDLGSDTVEANLKLGFQADHRNYAVAAKILQALRVPSVKLMTNNPEKISDLKRMGIEVVERLPLEIKGDEFSERYLQTKRIKLGHLFS